MQEQKPLNSFIKTSDAETAARLRSLGFYEVSDASPGFFTFINQIYNFAKTDIDTKKMQFTNVLCL